MRALLLVLLLAAAGVVTYGLTWATNSFTVNSAAQLDVFEAEYARLEEAGELTSSLAFSRGILRGERRRRLYVPAAGGACALLVLGLVVTRRPRRKRRPNDARSEDARLLNALGDPALVLAGAQNKAAALLGVSRDAPPFVIEAALEAQLKQRDPETIAGLAPDLRLIVAEQREELVKARDLLLRRGT